MENRTTHSPARRFLVGLVSDPNFVSLNILENLLSKNCYVNVVTDDVKGWNEKVSKISGNGRFSIIPLKKHTNVSPDYAMFVAGFLKGDPYEFLKKSFDQISTKDAKTLVIIPFEKFSYEKSSQLRLNDSTGVVYLGDVIGPRIDLNSDLFIAGLIRESFFKKEIALGIGELIYPIFVSDAARTLTKWIFSFGPFGKELLYLGPQTSGTDFWKTCQTVIGEFDMFYDKDLATRLVPKGLERKNTQTNLKFSLIETFRWVSQVSIQTKLPKAPSLFVYKKSKKRMYPKYLKPLIIGSALIIFLPVILGLVNASLFFASYRQFLAGRDEGAKNSLLLAKTLSVISKEESRAMSLIPVFGAGHKEAVFVSTLTERVSDIALSGIPAAREASVLADKIFGNQVYDPGVSSQILRSSLEGMYMQISLLQTEVQEGVQKGLVSAKAIEKKVDFEKTRSLVLHGVTLAENLPNLTGKDKSKTYLILFQNNMELRPTGGFIGSFGILTFDGGRIADLTVNDVYSADGQLNGHVEPPLPIKEYLGEANWWLRDSNWDPDFPTSAKRAEWFLDKEIGRQVDGVIGIDLEPIKEILKSTGPIFLADYNLNITSENLYEKTQAEVEDDFFPGTHKKASFLTALSRNLLSEISKLDTDQKVAVFSSFYDALEQRHLQVFLHDLSSQVAIANIGWDGAIDMPSCGDTCYADIVGTVEANVGVNKANYFVERKTELLVNIASDRIQRKLSITLDNKANPKLGLAGKYKVYLRLLTPTNTDMLSVKSFSGEVGQQISPEISDYKDRKETGVLVEVLGEQTKKVEFIWETKIKEGPPDQYGLYVRKQAGITGYPFSLTVNGKNIYNADLESDYFNRFSF